MEEIKCEHVGMLSGGKWDKLHDQSRRVYGVNGLALTMHTCGGGNLEPKILEPRITDMRGRNPNNPSDRTTGSPTEQRLEIGSKETSNTPTTVQKDNLVVEPNFEQDEWDMFGTMYELSKTYRIRKLTERECFRLMGVNEEDFEKVVKNQSTSSCYHLAGDAIAVSVLMAIFGELFDVDYNEKINSLIKELRK